MQTFFVDVILPLPLEARFTYRVPQVLNGQIAFGMRVIVPFGNNKLYAAVVERVHENAPKQFAVKYVLDVIDDRPVVSEAQYRLWQWMADYYMCTIGEVMAAALPSALRLASETKVKIHPDFDGDVTVLTPYEMNVVELLLHRETMTVAEVGKTLQVAKVMPIIKSLVDKRAVITDEEIRNPYKPKKETVISLVSPYNQEPAFMELLDKLNSKANTSSQADTLLGFMMLTREGNQYHFDAALSKAELLKSEHISQSSLQTLLKKGILKSEERVVSRLADFSVDEAAEVQLSAPQETAYQQIKHNFEHYPVTLLHGVTGSGKTEIYIKLIDEVLKQGKQVLYLLPEIALTSQIVNRLRKYFGDRVGVYHSRFNEYERVEIWNRVLSGGSDDDTSKYQLILGARSALLLPYKQLGLVIVDEEHDGSYKQVDPAPRYHARDAAVMLAQIHGVHVGRLQHADAGIGHLRKSAVQQFLPKVADLLLRQLAVRMRRLQPVHNGLLELQHRLLRGSGQLAHSRVDGGKLLGLGNAGQKPCAEDADQGHGEVRRNAHNSLDDHSIHSVSFLRFTPGGKNKKHSRIAVLQILWSRLSSW